MAVDEDDDESPNRILQNPFDPGNEFKVRYALMVIRRREERDELSPDLVSHHWQSNWVWHQSSQRIFEASNPCTVY